MNDQPIAPDRLTTEVPAFALKGDDLILVHPDTGEDVVWQLTHREEAAGETPAARKVIVNYFVPDDPTGTQGRHEFEDPEQQVIVRVPRWTVTEAAA